MPSSYDNPLIETYCYNAVAFGAATVTKKINGPKGKRCRVMNMTVVPTVTFAGTAGAFITVGVSGALTSLVLSTATTGVQMLLTAAGTAITQAAIAGAIVKTDGQFQASAAADAEILLTMNTAVGGSPAGTADVTLTLAWY